ncbi:LTA synthase family protein [Pseudoflavonifractor phocaeensis]|uniref:LTA synthase family protein n=1 Tax=Pseudoflavonifractor phocaeensis TaxID=1870988 RepID=UPI001FAFE4EA|nr:LTA synthase family protein [Pseudoflavonifractor phocaeensis]
MATQTKRPSSMTRLLWRKLPLTGRLTEVLVWTSFALMPLLSFTLVELLNYNQPWRIFSGLQILLNLPWYYMGLLLWYLITGRPLMAARLSLASAWLIGMVNRYVVRFRGRIIFPADLLTLKTAANVAGNYSYTLDEVQIRTGLVVLLVLAALFLLPARKGRRKGIWRIGVPGLSLSAAFLLLFFATNAVPNAGIKPSLWATQGNGLALNFTLCLRYSQVSPPEDYGQETVTALMAEYPSDPAVLSGEETTPVNLIVIMDEAFSDFSVLPGVETSQDPLPFLHSLTENTVKGYVYSSVFGGTTANSEYEFLTGNTTALLPTGTVPYQMYVNGETPSLVGQMKDLGYTCVAMHPYYSSGWNRPAVYSYFGFDETHFQQDFTQIYRIREYISDQTDFENLIRRYEAKEAGERLFVFNVTMQNHSGYNQAWTNLEREITLTQPDDSRYTGDGVDQYLNLVHETDQALAYLIDYFSSVEEPTMICVFGDHQPQVETSFYQVVLGNAPAMEELQKKQMTPFFIWANYDIPEAEGMELSINYLSALLTETANLPQTGYQKFLRRLETALPVINAVGLRDAAGVWTDDPEALSQEALAGYSEYDMLVYNQVFDARSWAEDFYTLS